MKAEEFEEEVKKIVGEALRFEGHVRQVVESISETGQRAIITWVKECNEGMHAPQPCGNFKELICFVYKSNDNRIRGILTKEKNSFFIELFLDRHKYHDRKRKYLGL